MSTVERGVALACLAIFGVVVWPTPYEYKALNFNNGIINGRVTVIRIHRFTGKTEVVLPWPKESDDLHSDQ